MKKNPNEFTPKQLERLPDMGYVLKMYRGDISATCIMNGKTKYIRLYPVTPKSYTPSWNTVMWTCCVTRKQLAENDPVIIRK